ncbi:MAG: Gfo/Idh/MocA family oxidoreductase [Sporichthyaceae bacterium]|nr:Gfo/Idh/MocA family oxidoreductase [Sporichthyaceae bacterium]
MRIALVGAGRIGAFHAEVLARHPEVDELLVTDADRARAASLADKVGASQVPDLAAAIQAGAGAVVIAAATAAHAELIHTAADAGLPIFCEKPVAIDVAATRAVLGHVASAAVPLQVGFQRRFDPGYLAARDALAGGGLGRLHTLRAVTSDPAPPHPEYVAQSGGQYRDLHIHDFDAIRFVTGREVETVYAVGANIGAEFFAAAGDVDTTAAVLRLDDGALALVTGTRYHAAGYDVRLELSGTGGTLVAGLSERTPVRSAETGIGWPSEPAYTGFLDRFAAAYQAELAAFIDYAQGRIDSPCTGADALAALLISEAAERSRALDRPVRIAEFE